MYNFIVFESPQIVHSERASSVALQALSNRVSNLVNTTDHTDACHALEQEIIHGYSQDAAKMLFRMSQVMDTTPNVIRAREVGSTVVVVQWLDYIYARFVSGKSHSDVSLYNAFARRVTDDCGEPDKVIYIEPDLSDDPSGFKNAMHDAYMDNFDGRANVVLVSSQAPDFEDKIRQTVLSVVTKKRNASSSHSRLGEQG